MDLTRKRALEEWLAARDAKCLWDYSISDHARASAYAIAGQVVMVMTYGLSASDGFDIFTSIRSNNTEATFADAAARLGAGNSIEVARMLLDGAGVQATPHAQGYTAYMLPPVQG